MAFYKVLKIMQYEEELIVEAGSEKEACALSGMMAGEETGDHTWYDSEVVEEVGEDYEL